MLLYIFILSLLLYIFIIKNDTETFISNTLINGKESKRDIIDPKKQIFLEEKYWRPNDVNYKYRTDTTTIKSGYLSSELKSILKPLVQKKSTSKFVKIKDKSRLNIELYLGLLDKYINQIMNNIYHDLFKVNKHRHIICPNINACPIEMVDKKIASFFENKKYYKFKIIVVLNIGNKELNHVLELTILYNKSNKQDYLLDIDVIGNMPEDTLGYINYTPQLIISTDKKYPYRANKGYYRINEDDTVIPKIDKDTYIKQYLEKQIGSSTEKIEPKFKCYGSSGANKEECENNYDMRFKPKNRGVWDRDCINDAECPFFNKNKNYKNTRGGCINGKCEMPLGIVGLGQRYFDIDSKPMCYNCKNDSYNCCDKQDSPDYIFENDLIGRIFNKNELDKSGLLLN